MYLMEMLMAMSIRLDADLEQRIDQLAQETGRTKAYYVRQLIANGLDDIEDYYRGAPVMERLRKGQETVHSAAEVRQRLGLES